MKGGTIPSAWRLSAFSSHVVINCAPKNETKPEHLWSERNAVIPSHQSPSPFSRCAWAWCGRPGALSRSPRSPSARWSRSSSSGPAAPASTRPPPASAAGGGGACCGVRRARAQRAQKARSPPWAARMRVAAAVPSRRRLRQSPGCRTDSSTLTSAVAALTGFSPIGGETYKFEPNLSERAETWTPDHDDHESRVVG